MNNSLNLALRKASRNLCVDLKQVEAVYKSYWWFVRNHIESLPLREISEEEFASTVTNFNIPYIGKLYTSYDKIQKYKNQLKYYKDVKLKKNKATRLSGVSD